MCLEWFHTSNRSHFKNKVGTLADMALMSYWNLNFKILADNNYQKYATASTLPMGFLGLKIKSDSTQLQKNVMSLLVLSQIVSPQLLIQKSRFCLWCCLLLTLRAHNSWRSKKSPNDVSWWFAISCTTASSTCNQSLDWNIRPARLQKWWMSTNKPTWQHDANLLRACRVIRFRTWLQAKPTLLIMYRLVL